MSGKFIVLAVAAVGWLIAALFAFAFVTLFGFAGLAFYGLLLLFICMQVELEPDGSARAPRQNMSSAERIMTTIMTARFFKYLGIAITLIGIGGFLYFQLDVFATIPSAVQGD